MCICSLPDNSSAREIYPAKVNTSLEAILPKRFWGRKTEDEMGLEVAYLGLGSNLGNREANLSRAITELGREVSIDRISSVYDTEPVGYKEQPRFLNLVCRARTRLSPRRLLALVKSIESRLGRVPTVSNGPRLIDIDILLLGNRVIDIPGLVIPHPGLSRRAFVLVPLNEIAPGLIHPMSHRAVRDLLQDVDRAGVSPWRCAGVA